VGQSPAKPLFQVIEKHTLVIEMNKCIADNVMGDAPVPPEEQEIALIM
jgi:hypothetical protein